MFCMVSLLGRLPTEITKDTTQRMASSNPVLTISSSRHVLGKLRQVARVFLVELSPGD